MAWPIALGLVGSAVFGLALVIEVCLRRRPAATRRGVWALAFAVALALPFTRLALVAPAIAAPTWLLGVWAVGAVGLLARLVHAAWQTRGLLTASERLDDAAWLTSLRALAGAAELRVSDELRAPVVIGVWRPAIVVPREMLGSAATERRSLLAHELAHVARADCLLLIVGAVVRAIYWPCPLVWTGLRRLRARAEDAADDAVLQAGVASSSYAAQLVAVARAQLERAGRVAASGLRARTLAVLEVGRARGPATVPRWGLPRLAVAALLVASLVTACEARSSEGAASIEVVAP